MNAASLKTLQDSTMFHMSLGSKELFHSNFLHWISIVEWKAFLYIMHGLADVEKFWWEDKYSPDKNNLEVRREFHNFDLSIYILDAESEATDGVTDDDSADEIVGNKKQKWIPVLILENKMKSLPYKAQLDKYVEKAYKDYFAGKAKESLVGKAKTTANQELNIGTGVCPITFILLSLLDPSLNNYTYQYVIKGKRPIFSISFSGEWKHKTYRNLITEISSIMSYFSGLDYDLIGDYCRFVGALCNLAGNEWKVDMNDQYINKICKGGDGERKLRIHDVREKIHYEQMLKLLEAKLTNAKISFKRFDKDDLKKTRTKGVLTNISFAHGIGLFEVQYIVDNTWRLIIQVQGNRYCHMIINDKKNITNKKNKKPIFGSLLSGYEKFIKNPNSATVPSWPNNVGTPDYNKYGRYNYDNIYQWSEIPQGSLIADVVNAMVADLNTTIKNF